MKKHLSLILVVLSLLVAGTGTAAVPMAGRSVSLMGVQYVPNKGPVFTFEVSGNFSRSALKGTVQVQGAGSHTMYCTQVGDTTVKCNASQKIANVNVSVTFGGSTFWTYVPGMPVPGEPRLAEIGYCYEIYDYDMGFVWQSFGRHCQESPAEYDDVITYHNPVWEDDYEAVFMPEGPFCSGLNENAYYYPLCEYLDSAN